SSRHGWRFQKVTIRRPTLCRFSLAGRQGGDMAELKDMLQGVAEAKQRRFGDEDFAGAHAPVVPGRLQRRPPASSGCVGGASVLGGGARALGDFNIPSGGSGTAAAGSGAGSGLCPTTPPLVAAGPVRQALPLVT